MYFYKQLPTLQVHLPAVAKSDMLELIAWLPPQVASGWLGAPADNDNLQALVSYCRKEGGVGRTEAGGDGVGRWADWDWFGRSSAHQNLTRFLALIP